MWEQTIEQVLACGCTLSIRWGSEWIFAVSHGKVTRFFRLDDVGNPMGEMTPQQWAASICPGGSDRVATQ